MKKILIVDDLKTFVEKEKSILNRSDCKIFTANSGEEALSIHKKELMDLIIADLDMPGMAGDTLCSLIRKDERLKNVSVIIVSNNGGSDQARIEKCGANAYIPKPIRPVQFLQKVGEFLDIPERQSYRVLLKVRIKGKAVDDAFFCSSRNISITGILIETEKRLQRGDVISCSFFLPKSECIMTDAEVMRIVGNGDKSFHYGVRFLDLDPKYRLMIDNFIKSKSGKN